MPYYFFIWNDEIIGHLAEHGVTQDDFEAIVCDPEAVDKSRTSERMVAFGLTNDGRYLCCVYEHLSEDEILPVTAYEVE